MTEVRFYHLQRQSQEQVIPSLLGKAHEGGRRVVLVMPDEGAVARMNEHLWTYAPNSFLPHGSRKDGHMEDQPIFLTAQDENPNGAKVLVVAHGAQSAMHQDFDLCCEILDGRDNGAVEAARGRWKTYKAQGFDVTYWQQDEQGRWSQKA